MIHHSGPSHFHSVTSPIQSTCSEDRLHYNKLPMSSSQPSSSATKEAESSASSCCRIEEFLCGGIGTLWGRLDDRLWAAWWLLRHMLYFGIAVVLLLLAPNSSFFVLPFFLFVHIYKGIRACVMSTRSKRKASASARNEDGFAQQQEESEKMEGDYCDAA